MTKASKTVLVLNFGSASIKAAWYSLSEDSDSNRRVPQEMGRVSIEAKHESPALISEEANALLSDVVDRMPGWHEPDVVAHRIVHGGDRPDPVELTSEALSELAELSPLAPLHQPLALALVQAAIRRWSDARQVGVFDTSWHRTMPEKHQVFPIPRALYSRGVKRYGFHGLAFQSAMRQLVQVAPEIAHKRVVLAHLGGGSSICAVLAGRSVNTSMGMTPLGGIPMATRSGSLDPGVLLHLQRTLRMPPDEIDQLLWRDSGLKGVSGESADMRELLASNSDNARLAIDVYVAGVVQGIAAMAACIGGMDALVFSGGIGMHAVDIRTRVTDALAWLALRIEPGANRSGAHEISDATATVRTFVLPIDEEREIVNAISAQSI